MNWKKTSLMALAALSIAFGTASAASANTNFAQQQARRTEVTDRVHEQNLRVVDHKAMVMRGRAVLGQRDAHCHGNFAKGEQHHFNNKLNHGSRRIGG
jgi:hypothetical protein